MRLDHGIKFDLLEIISCSFDILLLSFAAREMFPFYWCFYPYLCLCNMVFSLYMIYGVVCLNAFFNPNVYLSIAGLVRILIRS